VTGEERLYAFVLGRGLVMSDEPPLALATFTDVVGEDYLLHLAVDPKNSGRLFAATGGGRALTSSDQGRTWVPFGEPKSYESCARVASLVRETGILGAMGGARPFTA